MSGDIYTVGDGKLTQLAQREDGVWFIRRRWRGVWGKWQESGRKCPYEFGKYRAPGAGKARLPDVAI
jgi:hypothetical protein